MIILKKDNVERAVSSLECAKMYMLDGYKIIKNDFLPVGNEPQEENIQQEDMKEEGIEIECDDSVETDIEDVQKGKKRSR